MSPTTPRAAKRRSSFVSSKLSTMADKFVERGKHGLMKLQSALHNGDLPSLRRELHMLKGASAYVSATRVQSLCVAMIDRIDSKIHALGDRVRTSGSGSDKGGRSPSPVRNLQVLEGDQRFKHEITKYLSKLANELSAFQKEVQANKPPQAPAEPHQGNRFYYPDPTFDTSVVDHEKKLLSWNKEVYEARVAKAFVEERLVRSLYQQKVQQRSRNIYQQHRELVQLHKEQNFRMPTLYVRARRYKEHTEAALVAQMQIESPRFSDVEQELTPRLHRETLAHRGFPNGASELATPASMEALSESVQLPPLNSLMNPRNQMTSPLPAKESLIPPSPRTKRLKEHVSMRTMQLPHLLKLVSICFEKKRVTELAMHRAAQARPGTPRLGEVAELVSLGTVVKDHLLKEHGDANICEEKLTQLQHSCSVDKGHGSHPRIALFRRMASWDATEGALQPEQEIVCMRLLSWLGIASLQPPDRDRPKLLRMSDAKTLVSHLFRLRLIPEKAKEYLIDRAAELREPDMPGVDADALLWCFMECWGGWEAKIVDPDILPLGGGDSMALGGQARAAATAGWSAPGSRAQAPAE